MGASKLSQDPHKLRESREKNLETAIGREVREFRHARGMTVADLAEVTGLSVGMLSKIENGVTSRCGRCPFGRMERSWGRST
ncbi:hypothetical protein A3731_24625 [Roseovarius sp. HI0049]|nr:hypothetical protein A3731_24625 [Roseovarius sp. HI0049]